MFAIPPYPDSIYPENVLLRVPVMQFHLNGFQPGDPTIAPAIHESQAASPAGSVDVLIIGSGPAGLTLAAQLSAFAGISTRLVEAKSGPMEKGQADGVSCRSMEMFEAFGFAHTVPPNAAPRS